MSYLLSRQFHGRFVLQCQNTKIDFNMRLLQRLVKFLQRRKKWEVDSASKLGKQSGFTVSWKSCLNLCSLRRLKGAGCEEVYTNLFETSSVWQVFKVGVSSVPWDSLEVKKIIKVKFLWIIAATAGRFYEWVSVFLENRPRDVFCGTLSLVAVPKWFHNGFLCLCSSKRWQSVSWDNLDLINLSLKLFLNKTYFSEVLWLLPWVSFSVKDYYVFTTGFTGFE